MLIEGFLNDHTTDVDNLIVSIYTMASMLAVSLRSQILECLLLSKVEWFKHDVHGELLDENDHHMTKEEVADMLMAYADEKKV